MSYTTDELAALKRAYARGVRSVAYDGKTVTYDSEADMKRRIETIERALAAGAGKPRPRGGYATHRKGL